MDLFSNLSSREKGTWVTLIAIVVAFSGYFSHFIENPLAGPQNLKLFIGAVIGLVVIHIVLHSIIAATEEDGADAPGDERDELIKLKASHIASFVFGIGALGAAHLWMIDDVTPLIMANAILFSLVVSEVVQCVLQLYYYRAGV